MAASKERNLSFQGLTEEEVKQRLRFYGLNEIKEKKIGAKEIFLRQLRSPFFYLLFFASLVSFLIGENLSGGIILVFVLINLILSFFQEYRAEKSVLLLKKFIPSKVKVLREGEIKIIEKKFLVPGDIVLLKMGDIVPADLKVLEEKNLLVDESVLTGESVPLRKNLKESLFSGTSIVNGEVKGEVIATGKKTAFGKITSLTSEVSPPGVYEKEVISFSKLILKIVIGVTILVFFLNLLIKGTTNFFDFLIFCIALIVAIIPEALPTVVSFALSSGALKMAKQKVVVKKLSSIEELGNIQILCSDKTGTLTEGEMKLVNIYTKNKEKCFLYALLSSDYLKEKPKIVKNAFDSVIYANTPQKLKEKLTKFKLLEEIPFSPAAARNSVLVEEGGKKILIVKGAPEVILKRCRLENEEVKKLKEFLKKEGNLGRRILALGFKEFSKENYQEKDENNLNFLGFFSFEDPLKKSTFKALLLAEKLGVKIKILTGDSKEVAYFVAKKIGMVESPEEVIEGEELENLGDSELLEICEKYHVFARVKPEMKYKIVKTLEEKYEVGFLGEGINDAPALKAAQVGIVVESGADISKEVADIILLKKDLKVIVEGIKTGRNIFANIQKYIKCSLSSNFGNFYSMALISLFIPFLPMLPIQILLVNFLTDFPLISVVVDKVDAFELKRPRFYRLSEMIGLILILGAISAVFDLLFFVIFGRSEPKLVQTLWFELSIFTEIILIFSIRTFKPFWKGSFPSFPLLSLSLISLIIAALLPYTSLGKTVFGFTPPSFKNFLIIWVLVGSYFIINEAVKLKFLNWKKIFSKYDQKRNSYSV